MSFYVKGDIKPAQIYDVQLILEFDAVPAPPLALDYGDAPDTYGTLVASNGASATVDAAGPSLGTLVDVETDGQPSALADGDDLADTDDEDGVAFSTLTAGSQGTATVALTGTGYVSGWIDFNGDGDFADAGEQVVADAVGGRRADLHRAGDGNGGADLRPLPRHRRRRRRPDRLRGRR